MSPSQIPLILVGGPASGQHGTIEHSGAIPPDYLIPVPPNGPLGGESPIHVEELEYVVYAIRFIHRTPAGHVRGLVYEYAGRTRK